MTVTKVRQRVRTGGRRAQPAMPDALGHPYGSRSDPKGTPALGHPDPTRTRGPLGLLTRKQRAVVTHDGGPLLVVAGAGTGKTRVLVERIAWLIRQRGVPPQHILALTFTEKAAFELQARVDLALPISAYTPWIGTFHGFCEYVLREEALTIGLDPQFRILSPPEVWLRLKRNLFRLPLVKFRPLGNPTKFVQNLTEFFAQAKDQGITPDVLDAYVARLALEMPDPAGTPADRAAIRRGPDPAASGSAEDHSATWQELAAVYSAYVALQRAQGTMDFGDLQLETVRLLRERPAALAKVRALFPFVLVDEFQDTNAMQCSLVELLAQGQHGNLVVVSDDDQAIFAFRGSNIGNVLTFRERFPGSQLASLTENFRSPQEILDRAYQLIQHNNPHRLEAIAGIQKRLVSRVEPGDEETAPALLHRHFASEESELAWVAEEILRLVDSGIAYRDIAILVRTNAQTADVVPLLLRRDIPHTVTESRGLLFRPEVKDVLAYVRLLTDPNDGRALFRLLTHPAFSVHAADRATVLAELRKTYAAALPLLKNFSLLARLAAGSREGVQRLTDLLEHHLGTFRTLRPSVLALEFLERSGILRHAIGESATRPEVLPNFQALLAFIRDLERGIEDGDLPEFLDLLDAAVEGREGPPAAGLPADADTVRILTVHGAKGLEFPFVFVVGATADRYPARGRHRPFEIPPDVAPEGMNLKHPLPLDDRETHVLEERRLFYVALTRARRRLILTSAAAAAGMKSRRKPSPFITEAGVASETRLSSSKSDEPVPKPAAAEQQLSLPLMRRAPPPQTPTDTALTLSASKIFAYETCPLKYEFRHVLGVPARPHHALSFGITVHAALSALGNAVAREESPSIADALRLYDAHWISDGYESGEHEAARKETGWQNLAAYLNTHTRLLTQKPWAVEVPFSLQLGKTKLTGRIDRVDRGDDGTLVVTDFKTGTAHAPKVQRRAGPTALKLRGAGPTALKLRGAGPTALKLRGAGPTALKLRGAGKGSEADSDTQLSIYALAMRRAFHEDPAHLQLSYIEENRESVTTRTPEDDAKTAARVEEIAGRIRAGEFAANPGYHCRFCDFRNICDFAELS